ncbi:ferredoxin [Rhodococcus koreensis]
MKARVEPHLCQGHTICSMVAPDIFILDDEDGHASAVEGEVPSARENSVREAVKSCPERAITTS